MTIFVLREVGELLVHELIPVCGVAFWPEHLDYISTRILTRSPSQPDNYKKLVSIGKQLAHCVYQT